MSTTGPTSPAQGAQAPASIASHSLRLVLDLLKVIAFAALRVAEPLVRILLTALGLLSILLALFYRLVSSPPRSPSWLLFGFGLACGLVLLLYEQLLRLLQGTRR